MKFMTNGTTVLSQFTPKHTYMQALKEWVTFFIQFPLTKHITQFRLVFRNIQNSAADNCNKNVILHSGKTSLTNHYIALNITLTSQCIMG